MSQSSEWVSLGEAAEIIGVHPATIRNWAERGDLPFRRTPGGHRRFRRSDLQQWLASRRMTHPTEAQVVVQSALGRTRLEVADRQKLTNLPWYSKLDDAARNTMRQQGLRLMDTLINHLAHPETEMELQIARDIGMVYGKLLKGQKLPLTQALQGYFYFVDILLEAVIQLSETGSSRGTFNWGDTLKQVHTFTRETLVGMVEVYEQEATD
ncbi:MAG: helix-turn-helix domain-containing protein [Anaerolineae bacterium]|nr:helix-turn-helix domain-containing protein [Anaerolineae bacterium]